MTVAIETSFADEFTRAAEDLLNKVLADDTLRTQAHCSPTCPPLWLAAAKAGWFDAALSQDAGGLGLDVSVLAGLFNAVGRHLAPGPFIDHVVVIPLLYPLASPSVRTQLSAAAQGERIIVFLDPDTFDQSDEAVPRLRKGTLSGVISLAPYATEASGFLVVAKTGGLGEVPLFIDRSSRGVTVSPQRSFDQVSSYASVAFNDVAVVEENILDAYSPDDVPSIEDVRGAVRAMTAMQLAGMARHMMDEAVSYAKSRHQFGRPIGGFQPVQHILADMATSVLMLEAITEEAARRVGSGVRDNNYAMTAKAFASHTARRIAESSLQVHGGIAFTSEFEIHRWYLHILALQTAYGDERVLAKRVGRELLSGNIQP
jgi:alkylation response protein AidB-like acyl-CoA dehydrogenase